MSKFLKVAVPLLTGTVLYQGFVIHKLGQVLCHQHRMLNNLSEGTSYLIDILEHHHVDLTDFDVIALAEIFELTS